MAAPTNNTGIRRLVNAARFSASGIKACFRTEEAFRQEIILSVFFIPASFIFGGTLIEKLILLASVFLVLIVELLNTAVERAIDRISFEKHELSKEAKDMGSAAVLLSIILAAVIWGSIVLPQFF